MSDNTSSGMINSENMPTIISVAFVLVLIALALNFHNYRRANEIATAVSAFELRDNRSEQQNIQAMETKITALEAKITALEARPVATPVPAPVAAPSGE
ncbi:MAG: hypothetical protein ACI8RZ_003506 [Myxococcota bacterium]|jgi:uncharacterized protein YlxW (UPF0749 family)